MLPSKRARMVSSGHRLPCASGALTERLPTYQPNPLLLFFPRLAEGSAAGVRIPPRSSVLVVAAVSRPPCVGFDSQFVDGRPFRNMTDLEINCGNRSGSRSNDRLASV